MPELPEVETVKRGLERSIVGKTVASVDIRVPKIFNAPDARIREGLLGARVAAVERRAKIILVRLENEWTLAIHLKMTGQLVVVGPERTKTLGTGFIAGHPEKAYEEPLPHKHTHIILGFTGGTTLYFNDLRKFGWFRLVRPEELAGFLAGMGHGPEPFDAEFDPDYLYRVARGRRSPIKTMLLDQSVVAGVGNIYADEALFRAKIHPRRKANSLTALEVKALVSTIREALTLGIEYGGTTFNSFRNVEGTSGKMRDYLMVYGREGLPCSVCGTPIERLKIGQRSSHLCPTCQR